MGSQLSTNKLTLAQRGSRTLVLEAYPASHVKFMQQNDIALLQFGMPGNKVRIGQQSHSMPDTGVY